MLSQAFCHSPTLLWEHLGPRPCHLGSNPSLSPTNRVSLDKSLDICKHPLKQGSYSLLDVVYETVQRGLGTRQHVQQMGQFIADPSNISYICSLLFPVLSHVCVLQRGQHLNLKVSRTLPAVPPAGKPIACESSYTCPLSLWLLG